MRLSFLLWLVTATCISFLGSGFLLRMMSASSELSHRPKIKVLEVPLPDNDRQGLLNGLLLSQFVTRDCSKYIVHLLLDSTSSSSLALSYIPDIYSIVWNEGLLKNVQMEVDVQCDALSTDVAYRKLAQQVDFELDRRNGPSTVELATCSPELWRNPRSGLIVDVYTSRPDIMQFVHDLSKNPVTVVTQPSDLSLCAFDYVALGGTFDHLHGGHKVLLSTATTLCRRELTVGVTSPQMLLGKSHAEVLESYEDRVLRLKEYIMRWAPSLPVDVHALVDGLGPAVVKAELQALVLSSETIRGGIIINEERVRRSMAPLHLIVLPRRDSYVLSSSFLRARSHS